ncbi:MAG TPA: hypothetical protein VIH72_09460 [Candidatus Acidoferrales bacterium]
MPTEKQEVHELKPTRRDRVGLVIWTLSLLLGIGLFLAAAGAALLYWKESTPHYEAGALAELMALRTVEGNYLSNNKTYSANFLELDTPMGARANANQLTFNERYVFEFSNVIRDASGKVTDYSMIARPVEYKRGTKRSYLLDSGGDIFATDEHRPATIHDRKLK